MTGQCPCCGEQGRLNTAGLVRAHSLPDGKPCDGLHAKPGAPKLKGRCPHPEKSRFATESAAWTASRRRPAVVGLVLSPYECRCGWWHLTKRVWTAPAVGEQR